MSGLWYFWGSLALLLGGYFVYGAFVEKVFGADFGRLTPVKSRRDGVDYIELPRYKIFLIQLLNIAGLGPVIGPILGALYGPSALLWVVFGCIFGGAVHDYCSAMMSLRYGGASYPEIIGRNLGTGVRRFMEVFAIAFMIMVGAVFVLGPAALLANLTSFGLPFWATLIFAYYFLATIMPIDTIIGRIYPFFSVLLLVMAFGLAGSLMLSGRPVLPNTDFFVNTDPAGLPIWPLLFITIACGAISGFHATQSPLMTRCMESEKHGRMLFYGPMIAEGVLGLIWVTLGLSFYESPEALGAVIKAGTPTLVVQEISMALLGPIGGMLAILGVVVLPIGRHGVPQRPPAGGRYPAHRSGPHRQAPDDRRSAVRCGHRPDLRGLRGHLALLRLGQPDHVLRDPVGHRRLPCPPRALPLDSDPSGGLHDRGVRLLSLLREDRVRHVRRDVHAHRHRLGRRFAGAVPFSRQAYARA